MSDLPNIARLAQRDPDTLTARELQVALIYRDAETTPVTELDKAKQTTRLGQDVPALLAHIDELYGEVDQLRQTTQYHQDRHADAARLLDRARCEVTQIAIDTSPAYAELRAERDSARRERDEALDKVASLTRLHDERDAIERDQMFGGTQ